MTVARRLERGASRLLAKADAGMNRLYGWEGNPLYQSGTIAVALLAVVLATGVYLLFLYRIADPWNSVDRITAQWWGGRWIRSLHRFASDLAVAAVLVHAFRLFAQGRSWGPRTLAWLTGLGLFFLLLVSGWTGYVMVWDIQGQLLAQEGARLLDRLPIFSEPISRAFVSRETLPAAFFFLNLFLHIAVPVGMGVALWIHVARLARPTLLPPRRLSWGILGALTLLAIVWPVGMEPPADLQAVHGSAVLDLFYSGWLPVAHRLSAGMLWALTLAFWAVPLLTPLWARPPRDGQPRPSVVEERLCTGCEQCYLDCPYEAIGMVPRGDARDGLVARVDPALCVSCGICTGSCAPMGVGPPSRTGRDQLALARRFAEEEGRLPGMVVVIACHRGAGGLAEAGAIDGAPVLPVDCAGNLHTSTVEFLVRSGVSGVLIASCPPRDCWNREGTHWLDQRLYHEREAELKARVDRRRVRLAYAGAAEPGVVQAALARFRSDLAALGATEAESEVALSTECAADLRPAGRP